MLDLNVIIFTSITAIAVSIISFIIARGRFIHQQKLLEEQVKCKMEVIESMEKQFAVLRPKKNNF